MELIHLNPPVIMNVKKTAADEKSHLICPPHQKKEPVPQISGLITLRTSHTADNLRVVSLKNMGLV